MDFKGELKDMRNESYGILREINKLDNEMRDEIHDVTEKTTLKYSLLKDEKLSKKNMLTTQIDNYCEMIVEKSTMSSAIFRVITELISIFEGDDYVLEKISYHKDNSSPASVWDVIMILPKDTFDTLDDPNYVSERYFNYLLGSGLALEITEDWSLSYLPSEFSFYKFNCDIFPQINFRFFPYIDEFIDYIINYRIKNNISDLCFNDMQKLKDEFILLNINRIVNNYKLKLNKKLMESNKAINDEYKKKNDDLKRLVHKIKKNSNKL